MALRYDSDTLGKVAVPEDALWSAQTQRSLQNFPFGEEEQQPSEIITALAIVKEAAARVNKAHEKLPADVADAIIASAREVREGKNRESFPLVVWQTGSGTQSNMNMNEVLANKANVRLGGKLGEKAPVHPNDHVNKGQSSNDVFPSASAIAVSVSLENNLKTAIRTLKRGLEAKMKEFEGIVKIGRTHLMDAVPLTLDQEFSAYVAALELCEKHLENTAPFARNLAIGGTAVGTGLNSYANFDVEVAAEVSKLTAMKFNAAPNKFLALSSIAPMVSVAGVITTLASCLLKFSNDIRLLASGPRSGIGELILPSNEPGSSIMPGKVNPTQCESMSMVCVHVLGAMNSVSMANTFGHLNLNVFLPVTAHNILRAIRLLSCSMLTFTERCLTGMQANRKVIDNHVQRSLMLVTALVPFVGYDIAAKIAKNAHEKELTLKESAVGLGIMTAEEFDSRIIPASMVNIF